LCTQFWKDQYKPRNYVPWGITMGSYVGNWIIILLIRTYLSSENKRRDAAQAVTGKDADQFGFVERVDEDGKVSRQKVEKALLDMTVSNLLDLGIPHWADN